MTVSAAKSIVTLAEDHRPRNGVLAALAVNLVWGSFPILFSLLEGVDPILIVAHRVIWSLLLVALIMVVSRRWGEVLAVLRDRRTVLRLFVSAALLTVNWLIYIWAVENNHVLETSFGYFLNPLVNVALGMALLGERQSRLQAVSIGIAVLAMAIQAAGVGGVPWVALGLAISFSLYSYYRKTVQASSAAGLLVETLLLAPLSAGYIAWTVVIGGPGPHADPWLFLLLFLTGPATTLALLLFAYAVQRLRLTTTGIIQYIAPSLQFFLAIFYFEEPLNPVRLLSFALVWLSLAVFTADSLRRRDPVPGPA